METTQEFIRRVCGASEEDAPFGVTVPVALSEPVFKAFVVAFRKRSKAELDRIPEWKTQLREDAEGCIPPTYENFLSLLQCRKDAIPKTYHQGRFKDYKAWLMAKENHAWIGQAFFLDTFDAYLPLADRLRHTYIVGEPGSGKSELLKVICIRNKEDRVSPSWRVKREIRNFMDYAMGKADTSTRGRALVLIDPHGNLADEVAAQDIFHGDLVELRKRQVRHEQRLAEAARNEDSAAIRFLREFDDIEGLSERVTGKECGLVYINPMLDPERFPTINPFDVWDRGYRNVQVESYALHLARVFTAMLSGGNQTLSLQMETLLVPCITVLLGREGSTLFDLQRFMNDADNADLVELGKASGNPGQATFFRTLFAEASYKATKVSIATKCQSLLNNATFARVIASPRSTVDLEEAIHEGKAIIVNCAKGAMGAPVAEAFGRFLVAMVLGIALNRTKADPKNVPIDLVIDECHNFISEDIETILAEARGYGLHLTLAQQVVGQGMSAELTRMVLGNTAVKIVGMSGHHNRSIMAKEMGIEEENFERLKTGRFVVKSGSKAPLRIAMTDEFLGRKTCMSSDQWEDVKRAMLAAYYRNQEAPIRETSQLAEEIAQSRQGTPSGSGPKAPKYEMEANPFSSLDL